MRYAILLPLTLAACLSIKVAQADPPRTPSMKCIGGDLTAQPKFTRASPGRAEYNFSGICTTRQGQDFGYRLSATWTPSETNPANANASEIYYIDALSGPSQSFEVIIGAHCAADPWLHDTACTRVGDNMSDDLRALWPELASGLFPYSRHGIPYDQRDTLRAEYQRANAGFDRLQRVTDRTHRDEGAKVGTIAANHRAGSIDRRVDEVALNPQPLPPGPDRAQPIQSVPAGAAARGAQAGIIIVSGKPAYLPAKKALRRSTTAVPPEQVGETSPQH